MSKPLDLSVIIVSFNNKDYLLNCLNSLYENVSNTLSYEIIMIDNNSQDNTLQMVQENFPAVKVIDNAENVGFAKANNQGLRIAQGRYFLLLNNDTFVLQDSLEKLIAFMDKNKDIGAVSPRLLEADGQTTQLQGSSFHKKVWLSTEPISVKFITGAAFLIRKETYRNIGGMDEKFFFYNEDLDWCKRIISFGWQIYYYPASTIIHYGGKSTPHIKRRAIVEGVKGGLYFCYKHHRLALPVYVPLILVYTLAEILLNGIKLILFKGKKNSWEKISAFAELFKITVLGQYR